MTYKFMTREQWEEDQRALYADRFDDLPVHQTLSFYASGQEIAAIVAGLKDLYREEGRKLKAAKPAFDAVISGRTLGEQIHEYLELSEADREKIAPYRDAQWHRRDINRVLKAIRDDTLRLGRDSIYVRGYGRWQPIEEMFTKFNAAYHADYEVAWEERKREIEARPIDDEAWARELEWRARLERRYDAETFVHRA